jgi:hypothetical protein
MCSLTHLNLQELVTVPGGAEPTDTFQGIPYLKYVSRLRATLYYLLILLMPSPLSTVKVCSRLNVANTGSNPVEGMDVHPLCWLCVV